MTSGSDVACALRNTRFGQLQYEKDLLWIQDALSSIHLNDEEHLTENKNNVASKIADPVKKQVTETIPDREIVVKKEEPNFEEGLSPPERALNIYNKQWERKAQLYVEEKFWELRNKWKKHRQKFDTLALDRSQDSSLSGNVSYDSIVPPVPTDNHQNDNDWEEGAYEFDQPDFVFEPSPETDQYLPDNDGFAPPNHQTEYDRERNDFEQIQYVDNIQPEGQGADANNDFNEEDYDGYEAGEIAENIANEEEIVDNKLLEPSIPIDEQIEKRETVVVVEKKKKEAVIPEVVRNKNVSMEGYQLLTEALRTKEFLDEAIKSLNNAEKACLDRLKLFVIKEVNQTSPAVVGKKIAMFSLFLRGNRNVNPDANKVLSSPFKEICLHTMAQRILRQAESNSDTIVTCFAQLAVSLSVEFVEFKDLLLAEIFSCHSSAVPFLTKKNDTEDMQKLQKTGTFYGRYLLLMHKKGQCWAFRRVWQYIADILNLIIVPDYSAMVLAEILKECGVELRKVYGRQFVRLLICIESELLPQLFNVSKKHTLPSVKVLQGVVNELKQRRPL